MAPLVAKFNSKRHLQNTFLVILSHLTAKFAKNAKVVKINIFFINEIWEYSKNAEFDADFESKKVA